MTMSQAPADTSTPATEVEWPDFISSLEPAHAESPITAKLPDDALVTPPHSTVPAELARWSGVWRGWACRAWLCDVHLAVERVSTRGASIVLAAANANQGLVVFRGEASYSRGEFTMPLNPGSTLVMRMRNEGDIEMSTSRPAAKLRAAGVLSKKRLDTPARLSKCARPWANQAQP